MSSIRVVGPDGRPVSEEQYPMDGPAPKLENGQSFSLFEILSNPIFINGTPLEHIHGTARATLYPRNTAVCKDRVRYFELSIRSRSWDDMIALFHEVRRLVYSYEPLIHKPAPPAPPKPEDPSFMGGIKWLIRGIWYDVCRVWLYCGHILDRAYEDGV